MKKIGLNWISALMFAVTSVSFMACNQDDAPAGKGEVDFEITDAPSDDSNIESVMVTIAEVRVDGRAISGFTKQTIDLKAYQEGSTKLLGSSQLDAKTYSNLTLLLDLETDADGNAPGCYVLTKDNAKFKLKTTSSGKHEVVLKHPWKVTSNARTKVIMDFDLRKSIRYSDGTSAGYSFVSDQNLNAAVRVVTRETSGTIKGTFEGEGSADADRIIVYAYKKGAFSASSETQPQGSDGILFANAIASAEVKSGLTARTYTLAFLEEGEYELHFVSYNRNDESGRLTYASRFECETNVNGSAGNVIQVKAGTSVNVSSTIKAII